MYISGFCLFLFALLRMVYSSLAINIKLEKSLQAMERQAKGASSGYTKLLEEHEIMQKQMKKLQALDLSEDQTNPLDKLLSENARLEIEVGVLKKTVTTCESQVESMKKQAENQSAAYMKLLDESTSKETDLATIQALQTDLAARKQQLQDQKQQIEELTTDRDSLKSQIQDYDFMFAEAKKKAQ